MQYNADASPQVHDLFPGNFKPMIVGTEWLVEAAGCDKTALRDEATTRAILDKLIADLGLKSVGSVWHKFEGEAGVTGLIALTESHIACHTYPEHGIATFNLYCCRTRPEWDWEGNLKLFLNASNVTVTKIERGSERNAAVPAAVRSASRTPEERNAGVSPAVRSASRTPVNEPTQNENRQFVKFGDVAIRNRGRLPHWERDDGIYFVTFRLADSLPANLLRELEQERTQTRINLNSINRELSVAEKKKIDWLFSQKVDEYLDNGYGDCILRYPRAADVVAETFQHFDDEKYQLYAWCVMPNHVHVVFRPINGHKLNKILHSWKSFTSHEINKILSRSGEVWQREYYDHLVRDEAELNILVGYTLNNPVKAGLKDWKWVGSFGKYRTAGIT